MAGLKKIERVCLRDHRGYLSRIFDAEDFAAFGWSKPVAQINLTYTAKRGTVRGMHFQRPPYAEVKLVSCTHGGIWDVVVDLRVGSSTYLKWHAEELSAQNRCALLIPEGFAHGFQALTDDAELLYCHTEAYVPSSEAGLRPTDPMLDIKWPLTVGELSARDAQHPLLTGNFPGIGS